MKKVITYGTFDMLHEGHVNLLRRAKDLGDFLIVGVTSENYDRERGKLNVRDSVVDRVDAVRRTGFADEIIIEDYMGQKIDDIQKYGADVFAIGSDWIGKFDYLKEYCEVVYLERTKGISSTQLREESQQYFDIGVVGSGRIANRFIPESKYVSGVNVVGVFNPNKASADAFCDKHSLLFATADFDEFLSKVNAVYVASPHLTHYAFAKKALLAGKHVLCEKPFTLVENEATELFALARDQHLVLLQALKTAYCPGFRHLVSLVKSGVIGRICDVEATFTKLVSGDVREIDAAMAGGSVTELVSYTLLPIFKFLGLDYKEICFYSTFEHGVDMFTKGLFVYPHGTASFKVGIGAKSEGDLVISGTKGYAYVPAPWWKTDYFELRFEDGNRNRKFFYNFDGDGLRYELEEFVSLIRNGQTGSYCLSEKESVAMSAIIEGFRKGQGVLKIGN